MKEAIKIAAKTTFNDVGILRKKYVKRIEKWLSRPEIIIIKGIRRAGKTTILKQVASRLKKKAVYVNFDDYRLLPYLNITLLEEILKEHSEAEYFFFDEIQKIPLFESWLRTHYDIKSHKKFIISGSNISLLSPQLGTVLTGRNITFEVSPLDYKEFQVFSEAPFEEYLQYGGFPEVVLEDDKEKKVQLLNQYFNDILLRDILEKHQITPTQQLKAVAQYIIANTGLKISAHKLAKELGINSRTAEKYLSHMIDAYLIFEVPFFSYSAKTKYRSGRASKYYTTDNGLTTALSTKVNKGHLFETLVAQKLRKEGEVYYWAEKNEVDFVQQNKAYNVVSTRDIPQRETKGLEEIKTNHKQILHTCLINPERTEKGDIEKIEMKAFLSE
jgi:uncharacterized protein